MPAGSSNSLTQSNTCRGKIRHTTTSPAPSVFEQHHCLGNSLALQGAAHCHKEETALASRNTPGWTRRGTPVLLTGPTRLKSSGARTSLAPNGCRTRTSRRHRQFTRNLGEYPRYKQPLPSVLCSLKVLVQQKQICLFFDAASATGR